MGTATFGDLGINIERMSNVTRGEYGYVIMDLANKADEASIDTIRKIQGVLKVRVMR